MKRTGVTVVAVVMLFGSVGSFSLAAGPSAEAANVAPPEFELYFEIKLLMRGRERLRRVALDQWAGGRLRMRTGPVADGSGRGLQFSLMAPIEDPWTYRWYPTKGEAKLGAAVCVPKPAGDAFGALAAALIPLAVRKHAESWGADRVQSESGAEPAWRARTEGFWNRVHAEGKERRDPLHADPVYPFHVLGDPAGRLGFAVSAAGNLRPESITETLSGPWLPRGWDEWLAGSRRPGYGYWGVERPHWEPRTYETLVRALRLLAWTGRPATNPSGEYRVRVRIPDLPAETASVVSTLVPRAEGRLDWSGPVDFRVHRVQGPRSPEDVDRIGPEAFVAESGPLSIPGADDVVWRAWRYSDVHPDRPGAPRDELQVLAEHRDGRSLKLWIRVGYRPVISSSGPDRPASAEPRGG